MCDQDKSPSHDAAELHAQDLIEFHLRWLEFRPVAVALCGQTQLSKDEREVVRWLVVMADRIGRRDVDD